MINIVDMCVFCVFRFMDDIPVHSTLTINHLPVEIIRYIISFLTQRELLLTVAPVCQLWRELAYDPVRWRMLSFDLSNESVTSETLENCFSRSPLLHSLDIIGGRYSRFLLSTADIQCCAIYCDKVVDLQLRYITSLDLEMIVEVVHNFPHLESLNVEGCEQLDHKCIPRICDLLRLRKLNISHCTQLMDKALDIMSSHLPLLQDLKIDGLNHISDKYVFVFYFVKYFGYLHRAWYEHTHTSCYFTALVRDYPGWPVPEETFTRSHMKNHHPSFISLLHLTQFIASSLLNLRALQSLRTTSVQVTAWDEV